MFERCVESANEPDFSLDRAHGGVAVREKVVVSHVKERMPWSLAWQRDTIDDVRAAGSQLTLRFQNLWPLRAARLCQRSKRFRIGLHSGPNKLSAVAPRTIEPRCAIARVMEDHPRAVPIKAVIDKRSPRRGVFRGNVHALSNRSATTEKAFAFW